MEIWDLLKEFFSEVNFLLKRLSCSRSSVQAHRRANGSQQGPLTAEMGRGQLCVSDPVKAAVLVAPVTRWSVRVTVQKSHFLSFFSFFLGKCIFCLRNVRCFLRGWRRLKLVVMRPTGCGEKGRVESSSHFVHSCTSQWWFNRQDAKRSAQDPAAMLV